MPHPSDLDIYRAAALAIDHHGNGVPAFCQERTKATGAVGAEAGAAPWRRIRAAVEAMQLTDWTQHSAKMGSATGPLPGPLVRCYQDKSLILWCRLRDSNPRPTDYKSVALPTALSRRARAPGRYLSLDGLSTGAVPGPDHRLEPIGSSMASHCETLEHFQGNGQDRKHCPVSNPWEARTDDDCPSD